MEKRNAGRQGRNGGRTGIRAALTVVLAFLVLHWISSSSAAEPWLEGAASRASVVHKRREWFYRQRAYPLHKIPAGARLKALRELDKMSEPLRRIRAQRLLRGEAVPESVSAASWALIGPMPLVVDPGFIGGGFPVASGRATTLAVDPTNPQVVFLGAAEGGVWKTIDGGTTWIPMTDSQASLAIGSIALDPSNPSTIYAGTGEENFSGDSYYGAGILKSIDGGVTWTQIPGPFAGPTASAPNLGGGAHIGSLAVHPSNTNIILAGVEGGGGDGVYRSTDAGDTWSRVISNGSGTSVLFDPVNGGIAYAATYGFGVSASSDGGQTWSPANGIGANILPAAGVGRIDLAIDPTNPSTLYAGVSSQIFHTLLGLFKSTDGGQNWSKLTGAPQYCNSQCDYDNVVRVDPGNPRVIYLGGAAGEDNQHTLWRSLDGGSTWSAVSQGANGVDLHVDQHAIAFAADGSRLYVGNDGGAWSTSDVATGPVHWTDLNTTLATIQFYPGISIDPTTPNRTFGGTQDNGTVLYTGSPDWTGLDPCGDGAYTAIDPGDPNTVYAACLQGEGLLKSTAGGAVGTWRQATSGLKTSERSSEFPPLAMDPSNPQALYFGTYRVHQTMDGANNWAPISPDLTGGGSAGFVSAIAVAPSDAETLFAGTSDGRVHVTRNALAGAGAGWRDITHGLPNRYVTQVAFDPTDSLTAYVIFSGFSGFSQDNLGHVFKTTSGGAYWADISGNLPNIPVNDIVVDANLPGNLYLATDIGLFFTTNGGGTWSPLVDGLPRSAFLSLRMHTPSRTLRAASHGRSAWDLKVPISFGLSISPTSLQFPTQGVGTSSAPETIRLANLSSSTALAILGISASGNFSQTNSCPQSLAPNGTCAIQVIFNPTAPGTRTGAVEFQDEDPSGSQMVILTGEGRGGTTATWSPTSISFPPQPPTVTSPVQAVTLANSGQSPLEISSISTVGSFGANFAQSNNCGSSLAAGSSCSINVTFTPPPSIDIPVPAGPYTGALTITDNGEGSPQVIPLDGSAADFSISIDSNSSATATVAAGQTAAYNLDFIGLEGFSGTLTLTCNGAPALSTCKVTPASLPINGSTAAPATVSVVTTSRSTAAPRGRQPAMPLWWRTIVLIAIFLSGAAAPVRVPKKRLSPAVLRLSITLLFLVMLAGILISGCGGGGATKPAGGNPGTPAGAYPLDVKATWTSGGNSLTHDIQLKLIVR